MGQKEVSLRLVQLRMDKGVSAGDMDLLIGQCASYNKGVENGANFPSMTVVFNLNMH